jgi:hypothetical protein
MIGSPSSGRSSAGLQGWHDDKDFNVIWCGRQVGRIHYFDRYDEPERKGPWHWYWRDVAGRPNTRGSAPTLESGVIRRANFDPPYCLICRCYPDGAIADDDPMSIDRPRQVAFPARSTRGAVGGSGPT